MLGIHDFWLFVASGVALNVTPGPDTFYILGRSIAQGRRAGLVSVLGISSGILVHTTSAAVGLSALLVRSPAVFSAVRYAGAAYLVFLGLRLMLARREAGQRVPADGERVGNGKLYRQGLLTNVLNPKVALFFLAFLPQFVDPLSPNRTVAFLALGLAFVVSGTIWCLGLAWFAAGVSRRMREGRARGEWLRGATGAAFVGLGVRVARG